MEEKINILDIFAQDVFTDKLMQERLSKNAYSGFTNCIKNNEPLSIELANEIAEQMKIWAISRGATHYTHWFQPLTGVTAEKHDSFLDIKNGEPIMLFTGKNLVKGESDASSFPSGGLRATFEARGYTVWDPTSYVFVKDGTMYIPTAFCSYGGEALDKKTPLLRSMEVIDTASRNLLSLFGIKTDKVTACVGAEQEYFLISKEVYEQRKDLYTCGRTLFGAKPAKGQQLDDHYFGKIKQQVAEFMHDLDKELWKLGIYNKTKHNESAPAQHELAPIYSSVNIATDQNQITMAVMKEVATRHGMVCLLHEKPFDGVNGSGKHNNWSLVTSEGVNLLDAGKNPSENLLFLLIITAVISAVDEYQDLLRISVASPSNDHRLGANEAPPAIISMFLGEELQGILSSIEKGETYTSYGVQEMQTGVSVITHFDKDKADRNRTSPFAFTGNKFEFRMLGSMQSIAEPNTVLNTIIGETFNRYYERLNGEEDFESAVKQLIKREYSRHKRVVFNGNNYSTLWENEAKERGLSNLPTTVDAIERLLDEKNINLFTKNKVYTYAELTARSEIVLENYEKQILIESQTMREMLYKEIIPSVIEYKHLLAGEYNSVNFGFKNKNLLEKKLLEDICLLTNVLYSQDKALEIAIHACSLTADVSKKAILCKTNIIPAMQELRDTVDKLESKIGKKYLTMPDYSDILYSVKY